MAGLRLIAPPGTEPLVARLLRAVAIAGAPEGSAQQPMAIRFAGATASASTPIAVVKSGWMLQTVLRLRDDSRLASSSASPSAPSLSAWSQPPARDAAVQEPWVTLAWNRDGSPRVRAARTEGELLLDVDASIDSLFAAAVVQAALNARVDVKSYAEHETARLDEKTLSAWSRPPGPVARDAWRTAESTDARWFWLLAIVLLGVEQWLRGRFGPRPSTGGHPCRRLRGAIAPPISSAISPPSRGGCGCERFCGRSLWRCRLPRRSRFYSGKPVCPQPPRVQSPQPCWRRPPECGCAV